MRTVSLLLSLSLVLTIPCENIITFGPLGTLTKVIGLLTALAWIMSILTERRFRLPHPFHFAMVLFVFWNIVSLFWSFGLDETLRHIWTYAQLSILTFILWDLYITPNNLRLALQAYVLGAYVTICSSIYNYITGQLISEYEFGRYAATGMNAGDQCILLAIGLPIAFHLTTSTCKSTKNNILNLVNYFYIPASIFTIFQTGSRMGIFAIVPGVIYIVRTANQQKNFSRIFILALLAVVLFATPFFTSPITIDRLSSVFDSIAKGDMGGRVRLWRSSIEVFLEHPLLGIGSGALRAIPDLGGAVSHSTFLSILTELGLIGISIFIVILTIVLYNTVKQPKRSSELWLVVFAVWAIGTSVQTWEFRKATWLIFNWIIITASIHYKYKGNQQRKAEI